MLNEYVDLRIKAQGSYNNLLRAAEHRRFRQSAVEPRGRRRIAFWSSHVWGGLQARLALLIALAQPASRRQHKGETL